MNLDNNDNNILSIDKLVGQALQHADTEHGSAFLQAIEQLAAYIPDERERGRLQEAAVNIAANWPVDAARAAAELARQRPG